MAPSKKKAPVPESKFKFGGVKFDSPFKSGKKDDRHVLHYLSVLCGVLVMWLEKYNAKEEPYMHHDFQLLKDNPAIMEQLSINAVLSRKNPDAAANEPRELMQSPTSTYPWRQFVLIIGEANNTPARRKTFAQALVAHFNTQATSGNYRFVRKVKLGTDMTPRPMKPVDTVLLDEDVVGLMIAAYENTSLEELSTFDNIMRTFWTNLARGRQVLASTIAAEAGNDTAAAAEDSDDDVFEEAAEGEAIAPRAAAQDALADSDDDEE
jgi:hypothetical protein